MSGGATRGQDPATLHFLLLLTLIWNVFYPNYLSGNVPEFLKPARPHLLCEMDLQVLSFNVCGLPTPAAQSRLCLYLWSLQFNVLFLQEHKLRQANWRFIGKRVWKDGKFLYPLLWMASMLIEMTQLYQDVMVWQLQ
jgi:hypothetical protein